MILKSTKGTNVGKNSRIEVDLHWHGGLTSAQIERANIS